MQKINKNMTYNRTCKVHAYTHSNRFGDHNNEICFINFK